MDDTTYQAMLARCARAGYPIAQFRRVPQFQDQIGKPGFAGP